MRNLYLAFAMAGAALPMYYFSSWVAANGFDLAGMIEAWNVNDAATGLVYDLTISAVVLSVWVIAETAQSRRWINLAALPATFCIGVSCGFPLYLWLRSR